MLWLITNYDLDTKIRSTVVKTNVIGCRTLLQSHKIIHISIVELDQLGCYIV